MATEKNDSPAVAEAKKYYPNAVAVKATGVGGKLVRVDMGGSQDLDKKLAKGIKARSRDGMRFRLRGEK